MIVNFISKKCYFKHQLEPHLYFVTVIEACLIRSELSTLDEFVNNLGHLVDSDNYPTPVLLTQLMIYIGDQVLSPIGLINTLLLVFFFTCWYLQYF